MGWLQSISFKVTENPMRISEWVGLAPPADENRVWGVRRSGRTAKTLMRAIFGVQRLVSFMHGVHKQRGACATSAAIRGCTIRLAEKCPPVVVLLLALGVLSCGGEGDRTTIRFWNGFTGPDGRTMLRIVKRFNENNPDARVLMQRMDWSTYYNKLFVAGIGDRAPEVFIIHTDVLERFIGAKFVRCIDDMVFSESGLQTEDLDENVWGAVEKDGRHYAVPLDVHPLGVYYNKELFREAGLVDGNGVPVVPTTREEFLHAVKQLTKDTNADGRTDQWGFVFTWFRTNVYTMMRQWGGEFFNDEKTKCFLNCPENVEALQFCVDLIRKHKVAPSPENFDSWIGFRQGKVGLVFEGIYMLADLKKQTDLDYAGAPIPLLGLERAAWASSHNMCLSSRLKGEKLDVAWRFVRYLSDNTLDWAEGGQVPVRKSLRESERFQRMSVQSEFAKQISFIEYMPQIPFVFEFYTEFDAAVEKALRGSAKPKHALDVATKNINEIIARYESSKAYAEEVQ